MKKLENQRMEAINGGSFWSSFCATGSIIGGVASIASVAGIIAVSGGTALVAVGILSIGCGIAHYT
tara:strand:- start:3304 stop:3501 length:198 start_codon:yes stop_codon:yes gene_type:complete